MNLEKEILNLDITIHKVCPSVLLGKKAITFKSKNGYIALINDTLSPTAIYKVLEHEIIHIKLGHLDNRKNLPVSVKEWEVNHIQILE